MKKYRFCTLTIIFVFVVFSLITIQARGQEEPDMADAGVYEQWKEDYTQQLQKLLYEKGYRNAGITMTRVSHEDGSLEYTVKIHHKRIDRLDDGEKRLLLNELEAVPTYGEDCRVFHQFLHYE